MAEMRVGIRELRTRLSKYVREVKAGATLVITDRGKPIGRIVPVKPSLDERMQELIQAGLMAWSGRRLPPTAPAVRTRGRRTVAELLLEDRE